MTELSTRFFANDAADAEAKAHDACRNFYGDERLYAVRITGEAVCRFGHGVVGYQVSIEATDDVRIGPPLVIELETTYGQPRRDA